MDPLHSKFLPSENAGAEIKNALVGNAGVENAVPVYLIARWTKREWWK